MSGRRSMGFSLIHLVMLFCGTLLFSDHQPSQISTKALTKWNRSKTKSKYSASDYIFLLLSEPCYITPSCRHSQIHLASPFFSFQIKCHLLNQICPVPLLPFIFAFFDWLSVSSLRHLLSLRVSDRMGDLIFLLHFGSINSPLRWDDARVIAHFLSLCVWM